MLCIIIVSIMFSILVNGIVYKERFVWSNKKYPRPKWAGQIIAMSRNGLITHVSGVLLPISTMSQRCPKRPLVVPFPYDIKTYESEMDKGHIFALELGGPNIRWNIVMQPSRWQRFGYWRQFEKIMMRLTLNVYGLENSLCVDEIHLLPRPNVIVKVIYKLNYNKKRKLKKVSGLVQAGKKRINFYIKTNGRLFINHTVLYDTVRCCQQKRLA